MRHRTNHGSRDGDRMPTHGVALGRRIFAYVLLAAVMGAVAAMSWAGLYGFAHDTMRWAPVHAALVPIALDIAALSCAFLALDSLSRNDSAISFRVITAALVALSAFVNWRHALSTHNIAEQVFFPAMSVLSYALIDAVLRKYRRDTRRDRAGRPAREALEPLPRTGIAVWLPFIGHPGQAWRAISAHLARRVPAPEVREVTGTVVSIATELEGLSQADAIRCAISSVGTQPREVVAWLEANGWPGVAPQRVYDVIRRDSLRAVAPASDSETVENVS